MSLWSLPQVGTAYGVLLMAAAIALAGLLALFLATRLIDGGW